ncbi:MAG: HNH endonuclease signature motif containing protein [Tunicatimonas sp.]
MTWRIKNRIADEHFVEICKSANSMAEAASKLGLHFNSFKKRACELGCYAPNQAGVGISKSKPWIPLEEIIESNLHPYYQTYKLKQRLLAKGIKKNQCERCGIIEWNGKSINVELHHIDGNRTNHFIDNLMMLCPNCHSQTINYRAKNK